VLAYDGNRTVGDLFTYPIPRGNVVTVRYVKVAEEARGQGAVTRMYERAASRDMKHD
jgi:hypothetical protein